jgi:hypothetical protein
VDPFLSYFAGFFDGEGSIGIYSNTNKHRGRTLRVQVTQTVTPTSTELLREVQARWGGSLAVMNRRERRHAWNWQASARTGRRVLVEIRPWLRLKAAEADIALAYWDERGFAQRAGNGRFLPLSPQIRMLGDHAEAALKAAKRGGVAASSEVIPALSSQPVSSEPPSALW